MTTNPFFRLGISPNYTLFMRTKIPFIHCWYFTFFFITVLSCQKDKISPELSTENELVSFGFATDKQTNLLFDIETEIIGDTIFAHALVGTNVQALIPDFEHKGAKVTVDNVEQISGKSKQDFSKLVKYTFAAENGEAKSYIVKFVDTGIPAIYLSTNGKPIESKDDYVSGSIKITTGFEGKVVYEGVTEVKGRGNSTWGMPKKPYRIKLDKKAALLGMPADKSWALLANYGDQSLLRNEIAFEVSKRLDMGYSPRQQYVELFLNGEFMGNYTLTEHIKEGSDRVAIDEDNGGFILEGDGYAYSEPVHFITGQNMPITVKFPDEDEITPAQLEYITKYVGAFENSLYKIGDQANSNYQDYFDLTSFVNYYLANELCGNSDMLWSMRMYKKSSLDPKIYVGPVWDFDLAFNNDKRLGNSQEVMMLDRAHEPRAWMNKLMVDPNFKKLVRTRWKDVKSKMESMPEFIDQRAKKINYSQKYNFKRWDVLGKNINQSWYVGVTHQDYVNFVRNYVTKRITWLDGVINGPQFD